MIAPAAGAVQLNVQDVSSTVTDSLVRIELLRTVNAVGSNPAIEPAGAFVSSSALHTMPLKFERVAASPS
jgi:hypothetical protein